MSHLIELMNIFSLVDYDTVAGFDLFIRKEWVLSRVSVLSGEWCLLSRPLALHRARPTSYLWRPALLRETQINASTD